MDLVEEGGKIGWSLLPQLPDRCRGQKAEDVLQQDVSYSSLYYFRYNMLPVVYYFRYSGLQHQDYLNRGEALLAQLVPYCQLPRLEITITITE